MPNSHAHTQQTRQHARTAKTNANVHPSKRVPADADSATASLATAAEAPASPSESTAHLKKNGLFPGFKSYNNFIRLNNIRNIVRYFYGRAQVGTETTPIKRKMWEGRSKYGVSKGGYVWTVATFEATRRVRAAATRLCGATIQISLSIAWARAGAY